MLDYRTKLEILVFGIKAPIEPLRRGGGGPVGGVGLSLKGSVISAPAKQWYAKYSPYQLIKVGEKYYIFKDEENLGEAYLPKAEYYKHEIKGISAGRYVALDGIDALVTAASRRCVHIEMGKKCIFCSIDKNVIEQQILEKDPEDIFEAVKVAYEEDRSRHLTLTTGTVNLKDKGAIKFAKIAERIRKELDIPLHAQIEPVDRRYLEMLYSAGIDTIGIHVETFDRKIRSLVVPGKPSIDEYLKAWKDAVEIFGEWNVSSWLLVGLGESKESVLDGFKVMSENAVVPYIAPFRPSPFDSKRVDFDYVLDVHNAIKEIKDEYRVEMKFKAGCPRCGGCSAIYELLKS